MSTDTPPNILPPIRQSEDNLRVSTRNFDKPVSRFGLKGRKKRCIIFVQLEGELHDAAEALFYSLCHLDHETFNQTYGRAMARIYEAAAKRTPELKGIKGKFTFDRYAYCSCPCSPGVVFEAADDKQVAELCGVHYSITASTPSREEVAKRNGAFSAVPVEASPVLQACSPPEVIEPHGG